jgi:hypothetical protein
LECHNPSDSRGGLDLSTYDLVFKNIDLIVNRVFEQKDMPPSSSESLSPTNLEFLRLWIADGAPEFVGGRNGSEDPEPDPTATPTLNPTPTPTAPALPLPDPNFASIKAALFDSKCAACHNADPGSDGNILASERQMIADQLITPGLPDDSKLIKWVSPRDNGRAPRMPPLGNRHGLLPYSPQEIDVLKVWIKNL